MHKITRLFVLFALVFCFAVAPVLHTQASPFAKKDTQETAQTTPEKTQIPAWLLSGRKHATMSWMWFIRAQKQITAQITKTIRDVADNKSSAAFWTGLAMAFAYGVFHALGPGHGKVVVGSFFLSGEAKWWQGPMMGFQLALTHVFSAVIIVWTADKVVRKIMGAPAADIPWLRAGSYGLIAAIGVFLLVQGAREFKRAKTNADDKNNTHHHCLANIKGQSLLALAAGLIPCSGAVLIMVFAMAKNVMIAGILLTLAMGLGIAVTLSFVGLCGIVFRSQLLHYLQHKTSDARKIERITAVIKMTGACLITVVGLILFVGAMA